MQSHTKSTPSFCRVGEEPKSANSLQTGGKKKAWRQTHSYGASSVHDHRQGSRHSIPFPSGHSSGQNGIIIHVRYPTRTITYLRPK